MTIRPENGALVASAQLRRSLAKNSSSPAASSSAAPARLLIKMKNTPTPNTSARRQTGGREARLKRRTFTLVWRGRQSLPLLDNGSYLSGRGRVAKHPCPARPCPGQGNHQ